MEVIVALAVGALVIAGARQLVEAIGQQATAVVADARAEDAPVNTMRAFRSAVTNIELGGDADTALVGTADSARFRSWCTGANGWSEGCIVRLTLDGAPVRRAVLHLNGQQLAIADSALTLLYLESVRDGGRWQSAWGVPTTPPLALAIARRADTIVARIGELR